MEDRNVSAARRARLARLAALGAASAAVALAPIGIAGASVQHRIGPRVSPTSCTVITRAEAGAALGGQSVSAPVKGKATVEGGVACVFYGPKAPKVSADIPTLDTVRVVLVTGAKAKTWFEAYRKKVPAQTIPGLGNQAYYDGSASVSVLVGDNYLRIAVIGVADVLASEKTLAADGVRVL